MISQNYGGWLVQFLAMRIMLPSLAMFHTGWCCTCVKRRTIRYQWTMWTHADVIWHSSCQSPSQNKLWRTETKLMKPHFVNFFKIDKYVNELLVFGRPFVKPFALCYQTVVCLSCPVCLFVTFVHCGQTVGRIKMKLGMQVGLSPGHIVLDGTHLPLPQRGTAPPIFGPYLLRPNGWMD